MKKVLGFAWQPNSWDADQDGVEEGAQPNTMDVTYYGTVTLEVVRKLKDHFLF